eukprot:CAMPEP_0194567052 /NCGR_PEP_ID=MMETSP0292-20121207/5673_1 /TAXON_ID=39354 /ORGANISM="Heterosigma akashiwo, Strain CCMP2393" /LENGTH=238 /DNA_ID=CAMNT_0039416727 /DNA_START=166 /DNA_END=878 /DNA_ORIENTATION=-
MGDEHDGYIPPRIGGEEFQAVVPELRAEAKTIDSKGKKRRRAEETANRDLRPGQLKAEDGLVWSAHNYQNGQEEEVDNYVLFAQSITASAVSAESGSDEGTEKFLEHLNRHGLLTHSAQASLLWDVGSGKEMATLDFCQKQAIGADSTTKSDPSIKERQMGSAPAWQSYFSPSPALPEVMGCTTSGALLGAPGALMAVGQSKGPLGQSALKRQWDEAVREAEAVLHLPLGGGDARGAA